ncbi:MAG TPA: HDIG domain-containing protein [Candidatus Limnocylindrales bacterium]|nr:HDIG domain-containing protein [Candidatus Limnocylindrales bacterium]
MLAQRSYAVRTFTRADLVQLVVTSAILVAVLGAILAIDVIPSRVDLVAGEVATEDVRAPRALEYESDVETEAARQAARDAVDPQYDYTAEKAATIADEQLIAFNERTAAVDAAFAADLTPDEEDLLLRNAIEDLSPEATETLVGLTAERWIAVRTEAVRVLDQVLRAEVKDSEVALVKAGLPSKMPVTLDEAEQQLAAELIDPLVVPNSSFSQQLTEDRRDQEAAAVEPVVVTVQRGQLIVVDGELVTPLAVEQVQQFGLDQARPDIARLLGWVAMAALLVVPLLIWLWRFRPALWHRRNVLILISLVLVFSTIALKLTAGRSILPYFLPMAAAGMLLAILLDAWAATMVMAVLALLAGSVNGGSLEITAYVFLGGLAGIVAIRRGDRVNVFFQAGVAVAVVQAAAVGTFALLGEFDLQGTLQLVIASAASAGGAAIATVGLFAVLGSVFGIVTVFQLQELANPSQPLLRRLLVETPGTYHHALMVGNLAERAAESIGADPLTARVAAYYHDVGKLANPLGFIENQAGGDNVHDTLAPEESAQVLKQHVADGIDIAYKYGLPRSLIAFIPQHHGTGRISYFWSKAREAAAAPLGGLETEAGKKAAEAVDERRFRHVGPKPQSKEAAILMLADAVEASVRSLASRDEATIRAMVTRIVNERLEDGQFDDSDLSMRDIDRIREAFVQQLLGMYHQRIAYPQNKVVELEARREAGGGRRSGA